MSMFNSIRSYFANKASERSLAQMDTCRLSDLGLNRYDLFDARFMDARSRSEFFSSQRELRAQTWLR